MSPRRSYTPDELERIAEREEFWGTIAGTIIWAVLFYLLYCLT